MREYITEISKYGIAGLMVIHTACGFATLWDRVAESRVMYVIQNLLMFLTQLLMFTTLAVVSDEREYVFLYIFIQVFLLAAVIMVPMIYENINRVLLSNMCMLLGTGMCMISRLSFNKAVRQYIIALISLALALFIPWLMSKIRFLKKLTWVYGCLGLAMLSVVLGLGDVTFGSKLSFSLWGVSFQPSEFVKIIFLFFLAGILWDKASFGRVALSALIAGLHVVILVLSRDLGSALIFFVGYVFVVFAATRNYLYLLAGAGGGSGAALLAYRLFAHVRARVYAWRDPWPDIDTNGYAITQSLFAIGSGSWFGMGLDQGNPKSIPYVEEDFVFSSLCEELGVISGICILLITMVCFLTMLKIAIRIKDRFYQLIVYGIAVMYVFQIFLTVGGGIKLIPLTGVTLPFISYGGSSVMTTMIMFFIIEGIWIRLQENLQRSPMSVKAKREISAGKENASAAKSGNNGNRSSKAAGEKNNSKTDAT